jgi:hypothetical protein
MSRLLWIGLVFGSAALAQVKGEIVKNQAALWSEASSNSRLLGRLKVRTPVLVISRNDAFAQVEVRDISGKIYTGFVDQKHLQIEALSPVVLEPAPPAATPWSASVGASGASSEGETSLAISGELRYEWLGAPILTESHFGLDLFLGEDPGLGGALGQRFYTGAFFKLRPFVQGGVRLDRLNDWDSGSWVLGGGAQLLWSLSTYFEVGVYRYFRWDSKRPDLWVFGGSSGLRF